MCGDVIDDGIGIAALGVEVGVRIVFRDAPDAEPPQFRSPRNPVLSGASLLHGYDERAPRRPMGRPDVTGLSTME
jgi:hypothetical protein